MNAELLCVIKSTLERRGDGTPNSPIRIVTQFWSLDGEMIVESDPCAFPLTIENREELDDLICREMGPSPNMDRVRTALRKLSNESL